MYKSRIVAIGLVSLGLLSSCASLTNEDVGTVGGGVIGGLLGSQFGGGSGKVAAAAAGSLIGAYVGGQVGRTMDRQDKMQMQQALENSPTGRTVRWQNPDSKNTYTVTPTKTYYRKQGSSSQACREYTTTAIIGGKREQIYGKACRMSDGSWKVIS